MGQVDIHLSYKFKQDWVRAWEAIDVGAKSFDLLKVACCTNLQSTALDMFNILTKF